MILCSFVWNLSSLFSPWKFGISTVFNLFPCLLACIIFPNLDWTFYLFLFGRLSGRRPLLFIISVGNVIQQLFKLATTIIPIAWVTVFAAIGSAVWATVSVMGVLNQNSFVNLLYFCRICYSFCFAAPFLFSNFSKNFDNLKNNCASASPFSYERFSLIIRHLLCNLSPIILASYYKYRCCNLTWSMLSYSHQDG